jgi:hypothetical protein
MKETAVEWLYDQLTSTWFDKVSGTDVLKKAKEMEKEQIIEAWIATDNPLQRMSAEKYYNETYGYE